MRSGGGGGRQIAGDVGEYRVRGVRLEHDTHPGRDEIWPTNPHDDLDTHQGHAEKRFGLAGLLFVGILRCREVVEA